MTGFLYKAVLLSTLMICSTTVFSDKYKQIKTQYDYQDKARVIHVEPRYTNDKIAMPYRQCSPINTNRSANRDTSPNYTATIVGTVIGSAAAYLYKRRHSVNHDQNTNDTQSCIKCAVHHPRRQQGYKVTYRYHGKTYHTNLDYRPGKFIPIDIKVRPSARYY